MCYHTLFVSPVAFIFLNVLVLNIAEKLLAGRQKPINQSINLLLKAIDMSSQYQRFIYMIYYL